MSVGWQDYERAMGAQMQKIDFKKTMKELYRPSAKDFSIVEVPTLQYLMIDGKGAPGGEAYLEALAWLYPVSYKVKFFSKIELDRDYVVPPLEGIWWADDITAYVDDDRDEWQWTMMIMQPEWITAAMIEDGVLKAAEKLGEKPSSLRLESYSEGLSVQIMHIGSYADEAPTIARLHEEFIPDNELVETGHHHEIYIGDPRRTAPEKLKTVLRQPVKRK